MSAQGMIGHSLRRTDGEAKVRGAATYTVDLEAPRMLCARLLRSPVPAGRVVRLDVDRARAMPGVHAVATAADCTNLSGWLTKDQPLFASERIRHVGEPIAAVAAETVAQADAAIAALELGIEPAAAVLDPEAALAPGAPLVHPAWESYATLVPGPRGGNVAWEASLERGDVDAAFARDDVIVLEDRFEAGRQHQCYIEPRCAVAEHEDGRWVVRASSQYPFQIRDRIAEFLGVRVSAVRVVVPTVGGGFGGKLDASIEPHCALLARMTGRPVKLVNTVQDELVAATMRENGIVMIRSAVTREGEIVAQEATCLLDSGAYAGESPAMGSVPMLVLPSAYRIANVRYLTKVVYTNTPPTGAFRGVGGTYLVFAAERHLDRIAAELGIDRRRLRLDNLLRDGDSFPTGQALPDVALAEGFERIERVAPWAEVSRGRPLHGVGLVAAAWLVNPGPGSATLKLNEDGTVAVITAATEIGTGAVTSGLVQVVADALSLDPADVVVVPPDTDVAAYDAGAQGSRTLFSAGLACLSAAEDVRRQVLETAAQMLEAAPEDLRLAGGGVEVAGAPSRRVSMAAIAQTALWGSGPITGRGRHVSPPAPVDLSCMAGAFFTSLNAVTWHVHLAEVEVDPDTGHVRILRYVVAQDVGRAINPDAIRSQIQGSVAQGVGYALYESIRLRDGAPLERDLESYRVPTALDVPDVEAILMEHPAPDGPHGSKGAAEPAIVPVAAAIANAVSDAIGRPVTRLPLTPFEILRLLRSESGQRDEVART